jgi:dTDP-4-dehydrorhamnose 3,5-epimerase
MRPEFAHGFCTLTSVAEVQYKCTNFHTSSAERSLAWDDPDLSIQWPVQDAVMSAKDRQNPSLKQYEADPSFWYRPEESGLFAEGGVKA